MNVIEMKDVFSYLPSLPNAALYLRIDEMAPLVSMGPNLYLYPMNPSLVLRLVHLVPRFKITLSINNTFLFQSGYSCQTTSKGDLFCCRDRVDKIHLFQLKSTTESVPVEDKCPFSYDPVTSVLTGKTRTCTGFLDFT